jgi:hypothetical protein
VLVNLLFVVMGLFFILVACFAAFGIYRMLRASEDSRRYLQESPADTPLMLDHLSPALRRLAQDTRLLRIGLEGSIRDIRDYVSSQTGFSAKDLESFDGMLMDVSRQLTDWVQHIEQMPAQELHRLQDLGGSHEGVRAALVREGWSFERKNALRPGMPPMDQRLSDVVSELARIEASLQVAPRPYR